jgi:hypothetical protein
MMYLSADTKSVARARILLSAMHSYIHILKDVNITKTADRHGLLDLLSRPLPWLNPHRCNFMLLHTSTSDSSTDYIQCPTPISTVSTMWRYSDPIVVILKRDDSFHPIVQLQQNRIGTHESIRLYPEIHPRVAVLARAYMGVCDTVGHAGAVTRSQGAVQEIMGAIAQLGRKIDAQVIDYWFRPTGVLLDDGMYLPLASMSSVIAGLDMVYQSDVAYAAQAKRVRLDAARRALDRIVELTGNKAFRPIATVSRSDLTSESIQHARSNGVNGEAVAIRLASGSLVPLGSFVDRVRHAGVSGMLWFQNLNEFIDIHTNMHTLSGDAHTQQAQASRQAQQAWRRAQRDLARAVRADPRLSLDIATLRSSLHPFSIDQKRVLTKHLLAKLLTEEAGNQVNSNALVDDILLGLDYEHGAAAMNHSITAYKGTKQQYQVVSFTDADVAMRPLQSILQGSESDAVGAASIIMDAPSVIQESLTSPILMHKHAISAEVLRESTMSSKTSTTSTTYTTKNVDVYATIYLAHRVMYSDAPLPFEGAIKAVQNALADSVAAAAIDTGSTLAGVRPADRAGMVNKKRYRLATYAFSRLEITTLSDYLRVPVALKIGNDATFIINENANRQFLHLSSPKGDGVYTLVWAPNQLLLWSTL